MANTAVVTKPTLKSQSKKQRKLRSLATTRKLLRLKQKPRLVKLKPPRLRLSRRLRPRSRQITRPLVPRVTRSLTR